MIENETKVRVWLVDAGQGDATGAVASLLEERGHAVEVLDLTETIERLIRGRGEQLIDNLKGLWRRASGADSDEEPQGAELPGPLADALERGRPDLVVLTSSRHLKVADWISELAGEQALMVGLLPDYNLGEAWLKGALNAYIVPHEGLRTPLESAGMSPEHVLVAGPAISEAFAEVKGVEGLREAFGLDPSQGPLVLVHCVGTDLHDLDGLVFQLSLIDRQWQPIFYAGADGSASELLRRSARTHGLVARMLPEVENLHDFVAAADLVITHPGQPLVIGALAMDRPLFLVGDPGPVTTQCDFLVAQGAAMHLADMLRVSAEAEFIMGRERLEAMAEASTGVGRRTGTIEVVDALLMVEQRRAKLLEAVPEEVQEEGPRFSGPFEMIGAPPSQRTSKREAPAGGGVFERVGELSRSGRSAAAALSASEAKDQLAALILQERELERKVEETGREQKRWRDRLELAREWNEGELAAEAQGILERNVSAHRARQQELARVRVQKEKLKARVRRVPSGGSPASVENPTEPKASEDRFQSMEVEDDLSRLKRRLLEELDE